MKLKTKKILAKESLIFISCGVLFGLLSLSITIWNWYCEQRIENITEEIVNNKFIADTLGLSYDKKLEMQEWFWDKYSSCFLTDLESSNQCWVKHQDMYYDNLLSNYYEHEKMINFYRKIGFDDFKTLRNFIGDNIITNFDHDNKAKSIKLRGNSDLYSILCDYRLKIVYKEKHTFFSLITLIIIFGIVYPLRFLYLLIGWSIKTLST